MWYHKLHRPWFFYYIKRLVGRQEQGDYKKMKITVRDRVFLVAAAVFLAFLLGWFWGRRQSARPYRVEVAHPAATPAPAAATPNPAPGLLEGERININTASADDLERLPGIGETRAADIVAWRQANGPFRYPEDLTQVPGIGPVTLEGLLPYITVGEE